jgi:type I restriction enzyme S subunit
VTDLPRGWTTAVLGDVAHEIRNGVFVSRPAEKPPGEPILRISAVRPMRLDATDRRYAATAPPNAERARLAAGDVLFTRYSGTRGFVGASAVVGADAVGVLHPDKLIRVRVDRSLVTPEYLVAAASSPDGRGWFEGVIKTTAGQTGLAGGDLRRLPLPLAPLREQERIVTAIDEAFSKLDAGEAGLHTVRQLLKRMRDAVLMAAVTGRLVPQDPTDAPSTKLLADLGVEAIEPEGVPALPESWAWVSMGDVTAIGGGIQKQPKRAPTHNPTPFLRVANVGRGTLNLDDVHMIEVFDGELDRYGLERGDLLVVEGNGSPDQIGRSAMWHGSIDPCVHQNHLIRVRPSNVLLPEFLELYWNSPAASRRVQAVASSTSGLHTLSTGKLRVLPLAIPPPEEQARIVSEVDRQVSFLDSCEHAVDAGLARSAALRRSVLKAAFEGRLVEQDPTDEPASVLLNRIRAERAAAPMPARRSRRTA